VSPGSFGGLHSPEGERRADTPRPSVLSSLKPRIG